MVSLSNHGSTQLFRQLADSLIQISLVLVHDLRPGLRLVGATISVSNNHSLIPYFVKRRFCFLEFNVLISLIMVIRMRHTSSHTKNRRSHHALKGEKFVKCTNCKELRRGHTVCSSCGFYKDNNVLDLVKKTEKKQKKAKAKAKEDK
jgi:large subunit ribosomal protein L32